MSFRMENSSLNFNHISLYHNNINHKKLNNKKIENYSIEQNESKSLKVSDIPLRAYQANVGINFGAKKVTLEDFGPFDRHVLSSFPKEFLEEVSSPEELQFLVGERIEDLFISEYGKQNSIAEIPGMTPEKLQTLEQWAKYLLNNDIPGATNITNSYILTNILASPELIAPIDEKTIIAALSSISKLKNFEDAFFVKEYNKAYMKNVEHQLTPDSFGAFDKHLFAYIPKNIFGSVFTAEQVQEFVGSNIKRIFLDENNRHDFLNVLVSERAVKNVPKKHEQMLGEWARYLVENDIPGVTNLTRIYILLELAATFNLDESCAPNEQSLIMALSTVSQIKNFEEKGIFLDVYKNVRMFVKLKKYNNKNENSFLKLKNKCLK